MKEKSTFSLMLISFIFSIFFIGCVSSSKDNDSNTVASPILSLNSGVYKNAQTIQVKCPTENVRIRYTIDGSEPTLENGLICSDKLPIIVNKSCIVRIRAFKDGWISSKTFSAEYTITERLPPPVIPFSCTYDDVTTIEIGVIPGTKVRYTLDGTIPTTTSGIEISMNAKLYLSSSIEINAIAYCIGWDDSKIATGKYKVNDMVRINAGEFIMGDTFTKTTSSSIINISKPIHKVYLKTFEIQKNEVTKGEWKRFLAKTGIYFDWNLSSVNKSINDISKSDSFPMVGISWYQAIEFCNWKSEDSGYTKVYSFVKNGFNNISSLTLDITANGYRLPTEAEWEYAARGGAYASNYIYSGSNSKNEVSWYSENSGYLIHDSRLKKANDLGIFDMSGNVAEFCWNKYYDYTEKEEINPIGPENGNLCIIRGGSISGSNYTDSATVYYRDYVDLSSRHPLLGFRVSRTVE